MRFFNTAGPVNPADHYMLPPLGRISLPEIELLLAQKKYFVLHAPRQTGKTSCLLALMDHLNRQGKYRSVYINVEAGQAMRGDVARGMEAVLNELATRVELGMGDHFITANWRTIFSQTGPAGALNETLTRFCAQSPRPFVLLIDEVDSLVGDTLISLLRQLRAGYDKRPIHFPSSIVLCGVRDVRDYRLHTKDGEVITGGSAFNIKAKSLRLGNFNQAEVESLLCQHTDETGQEFTVRALGRVWEYTQGQPWLVNAMANEVCSEMEEGRDRAQPITAEMISEAKERLILRRETHLDQLADKLTEERVRRVIGPMLEGIAHADRFHKDDIEYVADLGLIRREVNGALDIANLIYREVIPRELATDIQSGISVQSQWYIMPDGRLDIRKLMAAFQEFFRENSESWLERFQYREAGPQLLMQAFLQRIINSGGRIEREYGLGRMRTDLLIFWRHPAGVQKAVIELKLLHKSLEKTLELGLSQTWEYMDRCGAEEAHLVIFDRREGRSWEEKCFERQESHQGRPITVWGM